MVATGRAALGRKLGSSYKKALAATVGLVLLHVAVYLTVPRGEFWPFSQYPMFAHAGHPWWRPVCVEISPDTEIEWRSFRHDEIPGALVPLDAVGLDLHDLVQSLIRALESGDNLGSEVLVLVQPVAKHFSRLLLMDARPAWHEDGPVYVEYTPFALIENHGTRVITEPVTK